ncbi:unnamed protein product, partial [Phaeothamnion confervicola]
ATAALVTPAATALPQGNSSVVDVARARSPGGASSRWDFSRIAPPARQCSHFLRQLLSVAAMGVEWGNTGRALGRLSGSLYYRVGGSCVADWAVGSRFPCLGHARSGPLVVREAFGRGFCLKTGRRSARPHRN